MASRNTKDNSSVTTNQAKEKVRQAAEKERLQNSFEQNQQKVRKSKVQKESQEKSAKSNDKVREKQLKDRIQRENVEKGRLARIEEERIGKEIAEKERIERLQNEKNEGTKDKKKRKDVSKDFPTDLLVVPQRQAAKKASENMMRTQNTSSSKKDQLKDDDKKDLPKEPSKIRDRRDSSKDSVPSKDYAVKQKSKTSKQINKSMTQAELVSAVVDVPKEKDAKIKKSDKVDKDIMVAYVPQRQAAKKAAEHIKGLGKIVTPDVSNTPVLEEKQEKPVTSSLSTKSLPSTIVRKTSMYSKGCDLNVFCIVYNFTFFFPYS